MGRKVGATYPEEVGTTMLGSGRGPTGTSLGSAKIY
jgi:hypothetical protein